MKRRSEKKRLMIRYIKGLVFGMIAGTAATVLFVIAFAAVIVKTGSVPHGILSPLTAAAAGLGALFGGYLCGRTGKRLGMAMGALCGLLIFSALLLIGTAFGGTIGAATLLRLLLIITGGALGGIAGVNRRRKR